MSSAPDGPGRRRKGGEKNANYLLQFSSSVPSRDGGSEASRRSHRPYRNNATRQTFDRLEFLHANFRFGVSKKRWKLAQQHLDWDDIILLEMTHVATEECPRMRCPISLDEIELPYMTPCGHVFSLVSILTDMLVKYDGEIRGTSPCPLCGVEVRARDLRPVEIRYIRDDGLIGSSVEFSLVWRGKSSQAVHDVHGRFEGLSQQPEHGHYPVSMPRFSRIMVVDNPIDLWRYVVKSLAERAEIVRMEGGQEAEYYYPGYLAAIEAVKEHCKYVCSRDEAVIGGDGAVEMVARLQEDVDAVCCTWREREKRDQIEQEFPSLTISENVDKEKRGSDDCAFEVCRCTDPLDEIADEMMYMYQISDGRWIFMSLLNMKMLHSWTKSYDALPESIKVHVIDIERFEQTVESRKRYKPFSHVPLSARVLLCEVDLSGVLPAEILSLYEEEISKRKAKRDALAKQQARRERLEKKKASVEKSVPVSIMMANMPRLRHHDSSDEDYDEDVDQRAYESPTGVSFAKIAEMGFAATGPDLSGSSPTQATGSSPPVWVQKKHPYETAFQDLPSKPSSTPGGKKKGSKQVLFMSSSQRQY